MSSPASATHPLAGHAGAQNDGQQLGIRERSRAPLRELFARLGIQGQVFDGHGRQCSLAHGGRGGPSNSTQPRRGYRLALTMQPSLSGLS